MIYELTDRIRVELTAGEPLVLESYDTGCMTEAPQYTAAIMVELACYETFEIHVFSDMKSVRIHKNESDVTIELESVSVLSATVMELLIIAELAAIMTVE